MREIPLRLTIVVLDDEFKVRYRGHDGHKATDVAKELVAKLEAKQKGQQK